MYLPKRISFTKILFSALALLIFSSTTISAKSEIMKKFDKIYKDIDVDLLRGPIEEFTVKDFTYKKDLATFHFAEGKIYLVRYVDERPTTAIFVGTGNVSIEVPSHAERMTLQSVTKDSVVNEPFEYCFIRMADDFDLALKEKFTPEIKDLKWRVYQQTKEEMGEFFFKPTIFERVDNYYQITKCLFERNANGYFWIDFNRYTYAYDPTCPQQVVIGYEFEPGELEITEAVFLNAGLTDEISSSELSNITYPTTPVSHKIELEMGGASGDKLEWAQTDFRIAIDADSLRFVSTFLHFNLKLDSIYFDGKPVDYHRRKDFKFIGIILPKYYYKNDTLTFTYWYHGTKFDYIMPYVENRLATEHTLKFNVPKGYNYLMPDMGDVGYAGKGLDTFSVAPQLKYSEFYYQGYATNFDTLSKVSKMGIPIDFLKTSSINKNTNCFVPDELYESSMINAFDFMSSSVGAPIGTFKINVFPEGFTSMPGLVEMPQIICYNPGYSEPMGGFNILSGHAMARQWFGHQLKPYSDKEEWFEKAAAEFLSLLFIESESSTAYYNNLMLHKDSLYKIDQLNRIRPLYAGDRAGKKINTNKGVWFFHMLRMLMFDKETFSDQTFSKFFHRLCLRTNGKIYTNKDIIELAEKQYGADLSWFFDQWLFNYTVPKFEVVYDIYKEGDKYFVNAEIETSKVAKSFSMPMLFNIAKADGTPGLFRETVNGSHTSLKFGPFDSEPSSFTFNEFYSVLCDSNVKKK